MCEVEVPFVNIEGSKFPLLWRIPYSGERKLYLFFIFYHHGKIRPFHSVKFLGSLLLKYLQLDWFDRVQGFHLSNLPFVPFFPAMSHTRSQYLYMEKKKKKEKEENWLNDFRFVDNIKTRVGNWKLYIAKPSVVFLVKSFEQIVNPIVLYSGYNAVRDW